MPSLIVSHIQSSIQPQFEKVIQAVSQFFRKEKDMLFQRGAEKERTRTETKIHEKKGSMPGNWGFR
ncbi:hypothetical protein DDR33_24695 [Pararcticibacter amylolyticus]|uniref:Uncharacterized protein n=1 Tax=Pararcticibacter amylolyticus TaxID=2173175 RepID=A0A2U2P9K2_9SPHI|nr:hypothetical protein DDR33_24695 [Pararcticibacter amylolyticus]